MLRLLAIGLCFAMATAAPARERRPVSREAWSAEFDHQIEFQLLVADDVLAVGTARHLYGVDPRTGGTLWRKRDLRVKPEDLLAVPGTRLLLVNQDFGGKFADRETSVVAIDVTTGEDVWESKLIKGKGMHAVADPSTGLLVLVTVREPHGDRDGLFAGWLPGDGIGGGFHRKPRIHAIDLATGKVRWDREFDTEVELRPSLDAEVAGGGERKQKEQPFDLGLYRLPVISGDQLFVTYRGVSCYDLGTGKRQWRQEYDVREGDLALSDAEPIVGERAVYTAGEGRIRAFDRATGKRLWQSDDFGVVPELFLDDRAIYGRLGGRFYHIFDGEWRWKGSYGAVALDPATGKRIWKYDSGNDSITNLAIAGDRVWLGDEERLVGLDRATGKRVVSERHDLEHRPVIATYNELDQIVLISDEEAAGYAAATGGRAWYQRHEPIKPSGWRRFAAGLLMTSGAVLTVSAFAAARAKGLLPAVPSPAIRITGLQPITLFNTRSLLIRTGSRAGRAFWNAGSGLLGVTRFAHLTGTHQYFVTKLDGADQALAGVNLATGQTDRAVELPSRAPNIVVDEVNGRVVQARGRKLVAIGL